MRIKQTLTFVLAFIVLLATSPSVAIAQSGNLVDIVLEPPEVTGKKGDTFELTVKAIPNGQEFKVMDVFLDFDPAYLEVVDMDPDKPGIQITPGTTLTFLLATAVDNSRGEITHCAGLPGGADSPDDVFTVANITFRIKADAAGTTEITFHTQQPRQTIVAYNGSSVLGTLSGAAVTVEATSAPEPPAEETESSPPPPSEELPEAAETSEPAETPEAAETPEVAETPESAETSEPAETPELTTVTEETAETPASAVVEAKPAPSPDSTSEPPGPPELTSETSAGFAWWWVLLIILLVVAVGLGSFIVVRRRG